MSKDLRRIGHAVAAPAGVLAILCVIGLTRPEEIFRTRQILSQLTPAS